MTRRAATAALIAVAVAAIASSAPACGGGEKIEAPRDELQGVGNEGGGGASGTAGPSSGTQGGAGGAGGAGGGVAGSGGSGGSDGSGCVDDGPGEPNDTEATAVDVGPLTDCDPSGGLQQGVLAGDTDVDWYAYDATDRLGCSVDPNRAVTVTGFVRLCKFIDCVNGIASVTCPDGSVAETSPDGHPGCCSNGDMQLDPGCSGIEDDARVLIRIDQPTEACPSYALTYQY
jgi:hypothetical protein